MRQEDILLTFVQQGEDTNKNNNEFLEQVERGWSSTSKDNACDWTGILCDPKTQEVVAIELQGMHLEGTIPSELALLQSLKVLILQDNSLKGTVPREVLENLSELSFVNLSQNQLTGSIPFPSSFQLRNLLLANNQLFGTIPSDYFEEIYEENLMELDLSYNNLHGTIPSHLGSLVSLQTLALSGNQLYGLIPDTFGKLNVERLRLDNNLLIGPLPSQIFPRGSNLKELRLHHNNLSGQLPKSLGQLPHLTKSQLSLEGNKFVGTIHSSICQLPSSNDVYETNDESTTTNTNTTIEMSSSSSSSSNPDERRRRTKQQRYLLDTGTCDDVLCPVQTISINGLGPSCERCPEKEYNPYLGRDEPCFSFQEKHILQIFHTATNGKEWTKENNWNITSDVCDMTGITCNDQNNIISMDLHGFGLSGTIPDELGGLLELTYLDLSHNKIMGYIPSDLRFAPLEVLNLTSNFLKGIVPPMLCQTSDINGNGKDGTNYQCDIIACAVGSYNSKGFATEDEPCLPCSDTTPLVFLGQTNCDSGFDRSSIGSSSGGTEGSVKTIGQMFAISISMLLMLIGFGAFCFFVYRKITDSWMDGCHNRNNNDGGSTAATSWWSNHYTTHDGDESVIVASMTTTEKVGIGGGHRDSSFVVDDLSLHTGITGGGENEHFHHHIHLSGQPSNIRSYVSRSIRNLRDGSLSSVFSGGGGGGRSCVSNSSGGSTGSSSGGGSKPPNTRTGSSRADSMSHINEWREAAKIYGRMNNSQELVVQAKQGEDVWLDVPRIA